jgi:hypothetical protein
LYKSVLHAVAVCGLLAGLPAYGTPVLIDNFNTAQFFGVGPGGINPLTNSQGVVTGPDSLGGARTITITRTAGNGFEFANVSGGNVEFNLGAGDGGFFQTIWDGDTVPALSNSNYVADLTDAGSNAYFVLRLRSDLIAPVSIRAYSGAPNFSDYTLNSPGMGFVVPFTEVYVPLVAFNPTGGAGADFTAITALVLTMDGQAQLGVDMQFDSLSVEPVPEPGTALMMLGSVLLLGAGLLRRRK